MQYTGVIIFCVLAVVVICCKCDETYRIAVVEHSPFYQKGFVNRTEALKIMNINMDRYEEKIMIAAKQMAQIILFPEDGLYGADFYTKDQILPYLEPIPEITTTPIYPYLEKDLNITSPILCRGSYLAKKYNIYIVFDMGEVKYCSSSSDPLCPENGRYQYNTLVAFDPNGIILAKYHKSHLYYEPQFDQPLVPDVVYFDTSFGVRFGMLICFDVMFLEPQFSLWNNHGVRDFLWASFWVNFPPMITSTQTQQARSLFFPGNFIASGIGLSWYNSGSGIYSYGRYLETFYNPTATPREKFLISDLPIIQNHSSAPLINSTSGDAPYTGDEVFTFQTIIPSSFQSYEMEIQSTYLQCNARFSVTSNTDNAVVGLIAITGNYNNLFPSEICCLMICYSETDCDSPVLQSSLVLDSWNLYGNFTDYRKIVYPLAATNDAFILNDNYVVSENYKTLTSTNVNNAKPFLNAALFSVL